METYISSMSLMPLLVTYAYSHAKIIRLTLPHDVFWIFIPTTLSHELLSAVTTPSNSSRRHIRNSLYLYLVNHPIHFPISTRALLNAHSVKFYDTPAYFASCGQIVPITLVILQLYLHRKSLITPPIRTLTAHPMNFSLASITTLSRYLYNTPLSLSHDQSITLSTK